MLSTEQENKEEKVRLFSAGVLIRRMTSAGPLFLMGHVTRRSHFDFFKGGVEEGETPLQAALRECQEESNIHVTEDEIIFADEKRKYTSSKDIQLFLADITHRDLSQITVKCNTGMETIGYPEMDGYSWFTFDEMLIAGCFSYGKLVRRIREQLTAELPV